MPQDLSSATEDMGGTVGFPHDFDWISGAGMSHHKMLPVKPPNLKKAPFLQIQGPDNPTSGAWLLETQDCETNGMEAIV